METDETKYNPEFSRMYLEDLLMDNETSQINLEDITKLSIIKNIKQIDKKMKLFDPKIYNNTRTFFLTVES